LVYATQRSISGLQTDSSTFTSRKVNQTFQLEDLAWLIVAQTCSSWSKLMDAFVGKKSRCGQECGQECGQVNRTSATCLRELSRLHAIADIEIDITND
jgi:hypothetical protein